MKLHFTPTFDLYKQYKFEEISLIEFIENLQKPLVDYAKTLQINIEDLRAVAISPGETSNLNTAAMINNKLDIIIGYINEKEAPDHMPIYTRENVKQALLLLCELAEQSNKDRDFPWLNLFKNDTKKYSVAAGIVQHLLFYFACKENDLFENISAFARTEQNSLFIQSIEEIEKICTEFHSQLYPSLTK